MPPSCVGSRCGTHGFDDQGRKYDASGNMNDWWQAADAEQFNARVAVIVKQANDTVVHTQDEECEERKAGPFSLSKFGVRSVVAKDCTCRNVNGELTQGENIADLGGLRLAYRAWGEYVKTNGADGAAAPDNFPKDSAKRFFFSWATIWRQNITAKLAAKYIAVDPHAPPEVRVNGRGVDVTRARRLLSRVGQGDQPPQLPSSDRCSSLRALLPAAAAPSGGGRPPLG